MKRRLDFRLTRRQAAERLGVSKTTLWDWENSRYQAEIGRWPAILTFLEYEPFPEPVRLSERLLAIQRREGWGVRELSEKLGVGVSTISRWRAGLRPKNRRSWEALERLLGKEGLEVRE